VLYVIAVGQYQLFVNPNLPTPGWLRIADLDDLKERLLGTIVVLLAVSFLGCVVTWDGSFSLVAAGAAIGAVLVALGLSLRQFHHEADHAPGESGGRSERKRRFRRSSSGNAHDRSQTLDNTDS
jgi:uncharacterized membrane protein YqhA